MADEGYTEYPFCSGDMDFTFTPRHAVYPRLISGARADTGRTNSADLVVDHVYQPDGCVWGAEAREFVQTFTASSSELVSVTLLVASAPSMFEVSILEGGVAGQRIGPTRRFHAGHSVEWGTARWLAGQVPLVAGRTYAVRIRRVDGAAWRPYLHSLGDAYAGGILHIDGVPQPDSDLALWILQQPDDLARGLIDGTNDEGWAYDVTEVWFRPRSVNIRLVMLGLTPVDMEPATKHNCCDIVIRIYDESGKSVAGPKRSLACGKVGDHEAPFLFASSELPVDQDQRYRLTAFTIPHQAQLPKPPDVPVVRRDMKLEVFGEPEIGTMPVIYNLRATIPERGKLKLDWNTNFDFATRVAMEGDGMEGGQPGRKLAYFGVPAKTTELTVSAWPGHTYQFRLTATGPTGRKWRTPRYQITMWRDDESEAFLQARLPTPNVFLPLAPAKISSGRPERPLRYRNQVPIVNGGFEEGLRGWRVTDKQLSFPNVGIGGNRLLKSLGIATKWGDRLAGFTDQAGKKREQVFWEATLWQSMNSTPGHVYSVSMMANTSVAGAPRGDTRVRLVADPADGTSWQHPNSSQWFWTDAQWKRLSHRFRATGRRATIGTSFFRWRDTDRASAYVDELHVYDLGPAPTEMDDEAPLPVITAGHLQKPARQVALVDSKWEVDERVEGFAQAPPGFAITGVGARAHYDNITTIWLRVRPLRADGSLGPEEQIRSGWEKDSHLEAKVELPSGYVATGFGAGIAPEWDVKRLGVWARPLNDDGTLGDEKLFRGGIDLDSGFEKTVRLPPGRILTSVGLNCGFNDVNRIKATSARLIRTAYGQQRGE